MHLHEDSLCVGETGGVSDVRLRIALCMAVHVVLELVWTPEYKHVTHSVHSDCHHLHAPTYAHNTIVNHT
jgi:hypothetical protein